MDPRTTLGLCRHAVSVRPSICLSVTFVDFVEMNKHIFKKNLPSDIATPLYCSFSISNAMAIFIRGSPIIGPYRGVECRWGRQKLRFSTNIWLPDRWLVECEQQLRRSTVQFTAQTAVTHQWILFITDGSMDDHDEEKRTEQNVIIVHSEKSEAEVTNNRRLRSTFCTIETNYWQTRSIARPLCDSKATCLFCAMVKCNVGC